MKTKLSQSDDDDEIKKRIRRLQSGTTKNNNTNQVIEDLLDDHRRRKFFEDPEEGYRRLKEDMMNDPELREQVEEEQRRWDNTLMDGLEDEEVHVMKTKNGHVFEIVTNVDPQLCSTRDVTMSTLVRWFGHCVPLSDEEVIAMITEALEELQVVGDHGQLF